VLGVELSHGDTVSFPCGGFCRPLIEQILPGLVFGSWPPPSPRTGGADLGGAVVDDLLRLHDRDGSQLSGLLLLPRHLEGVEEGGLQWARQWGFDFPIFLLGRVFLMASSMYPTLAHRHRPMVKAL
jgi:hypothetical protein